VIGGMNWITLSTPPMNTGGHIGGDARTLPAQPLDRPLAASATSTVDRHAADVAAAELADAVGAVARAAEDDDGLRTVRRSLLSCRADGRGRRSRSDGSRGRAWSAGLHVDR
jgi:hypothetical protein